MAHALDEKILQYLPLLNSEQKKSLLGVITAFLKPKLGDERISIEQYNHELDETLSEVREGKFVTQEELTKQAKKW